MGEIGMMAVAVTLMPVSLLTVFPASGPETWSPFLADAGAVTMQHIDSGLSGFIAVLLAFFALLIGGPIATGQPTAAGTRRLLGFTSELMASFLLPAVVLVAAACITDPRQCGSLVVIIPQVGIILFLALNLGCFIVFEPALLIAAAETSRHVVRQRLRSLGLRSRKPTITVFGMNVGAGIVLGAAGALACGAGLGAVVTAALISGVLTLGLAPIVTVLAAASLSATERSSRIMGWMTLGFFWFGSLAGSLLTAGPHGERIVAVTAPMVIVGLSVTVPIVRSRRLADWSLHGLARRSAARSLARAYAGHVNTLIDSRVRPISGATHTFLPSVRAALCAIHRSWSRPV
ncbi:hypothetical protein C5C00_09300 [Rathayibacter rathayi]|nr:hypothetical protein C5C47_08745 [Rathayibacter rathayi]PPG96088.1 hypothetical protein C5C00_09300 [Rathayibacter rathayi]